MISGYPHRSSVAAGETFGLHVSTDAAQFRGDFYRRGNGLTPIAASDWRNGVDSPAPPHPDGSDRLSPAQAWDWPLYEFPIPQSWRTGLYQAVFVEGDGKGVATGAPDPQDIDSTDRDWFVVRRAQPGGSSILYKKEVATRTAYNTPGDSGLYDHPVYVDGPGPKGHKVSLHRPGGVGDLRWGDIQFIAWLERNGFGVDYCTDIDVHEDSSLLSHYQLMLAVGHEEYWSAGMREHVQAFIAAGGNVAFFSGNTCWWRIHFVDGNTAYVCDTDHHDNGAPPHLPATDQWWAPAPNGVGDPKNRLTGVSYRNGGAWAGARDKLGYTIQNSDHWVFAGTGLRDGDLLGTSVALVGYECDGAAFSRDEAGVAVPTGEDGTPAGFAILGLAELSPIADDYYDGSRTPWHCPPREASTASPRAATMGVYEAVGTVFTGSAVEWPIAIGSGADPLVEQVARNVIERLSGIGVFELDPRVGDAYPSWTALGGAAATVALAFAGGFLYAATADRRLLRRESLDRDAAWITLDPSTPPIVAMAGVGDTLYATISVFDGSALVTRSVSTSEAAWEAVGANNAAGIVAMAGGLESPAGERRLYALGSGNRIWRRRLTLDDAEDWEVFAASNGLVGLGVSWFGNVSMLYAATAGGFIVGRNAAAVAGPWHVLGILDQVTAMTAAEFSAHAGALLAQTSDGLLWRLDTAAIT